MGWSSLATGRTMIICLSVLATAAATQIDTDGAQLSGAVYPSDSLKGPDLLQESPRNTVYTADPMTGFMTLSAIVLIALVAWLVFNLNENPLTGLIQSRALKETLTGMSLDTTVAVLECLRREEAKLSCLVCVASTIDSDTCW
ncbi:uncharacterized protein LOC121866766 [Homarus americanus]|uniref:uncharacterized protein LOC121866766 n=1 Tax=Homarus americanus TaxID=6706 RepID=UPI001C481EFA|nr:uncharacterized protein LOC121866766 [Homarus americanus]XP_042222397.1 uncharacterized protein LOC121866766 [Homarus americanus]